MEILKNNISADQFFDKLSVAAEKVLISDFDGTLAPFCRERDRVRMYDRIDEQLKLIIKKTNTRLIIVSGRPLADLLALWPISPLPEIWGSHGGEQYYPGEEIRRIAMPEALNRVIIEITDWADREKISSLMEKNPSALLSTGVDYRPIDKTKSDKCFSPSRPVTPMKTGLSFMILTADWKSDRPVSTKDRWWKAY